MKEAPNEFAALSDYLLARLPCLNCCDHTLAHTRAWLRENTAPAEHEGFLTFLAELGGSCDCRVLRGLHAIPQPGERVH